MNRFLIDTNVLSEFSRKGEPDPKVKSWLAAADASSLYVSVLTLAEILRGIELRESGKRRVQLEKWLRDELVPSFDPEKILSVTQAIANRWALLSARGEQKGKPLALFDGLLAATAIQHSLIVVTRDKDSTSLGIPLFNPWEF